MTARSFAGLAICLGIVAAGCAVPRPMPAPPPAPQPAPIPPLPEVPVQTVVTTLRTSDSTGPRITLNSANADLRELLPLLAEAAGVNLILGPEVRGRISVRFQNVRAIDALTAVIEQAGLIVGPAGPELPWGRPVFYDLPVNINVASAAAIKARFDVTQPLADWIVNGRTFCYPGKCPGAKY